MKRLLLIFLLFPFTLMAQNSFTQEFQFLNYLINQHELKLCELELNHVDTGLLNSSQNDSLQYIWGWKKYNEKQLAVANQHWKDISKKSVFSTKTIFFTAYNLTFLKKIDSSNFVLNNLITENSKLLLALQQFELAGNFLLRKKYFQFDSLANKFDTSFYQLSNQQSLLIKDSKIQRKIKHRSPAIAATLSAIVPGLGKIYAGKSKQGIASMLPMLMLGGITWENYHKGGVKSVGFITAASVFSIFYLGNIMGSAFAVKIEREEKQNAIENKILLDMHIPLRNVFN